MISVFFLFIVSQFVFAESLKLKELVFTEQLRPESFTFVSEGKFKSSEGEFLLLKREEFALPIAEKIIKNRLTQLKLLFAPRSAPYPGMITIDQNCIDTAKFPAKIENSENSIFWLTEMPASSDFTYATCGNRKDIYLSQYLVIYCKSTKILFDIKYFLPLGKKPFLTGIALAKCI